MSNHVFNVSPALVRGLLGVNVEVGTYLVVGASGYLNPKAATMVYVHTVLTADSADFIDLANDFISRGFEIWYVMDESRYEYVVGYVRCAWCGALQPLSQVCDELGRLVCLDRDACDSRIKWDEEVLRMLRCCADA